MKAQAFIAMSIILCLNYPISANDVYKWTDENGVTHFSDTPPETEAFSEVEIKINSYESTSIESNYSNSDSSINTVIMYGTSWCPYCKKAKEYFASKGIPYKEYDIENSDKARREYDKLGGRGVPVILVGSKRLNGFSVDAFERIYN